ncbi:phosphotransferase family protein [Micromonospora olivasterospora]|uniref:Aminoglycoside phosphotransferase (APT) family kinase protein n=1 Tax=Micromonospora olivasterospora TaxID=1880 RepID=A0A562I3U3_MICOL|nr:phosphotransferase family protein [Micromonospora olivasterospora]TWH65303.1 aminoglycoside phosphotransferase (APT) family kinase protein [Micromonospora olivasterospora]
MTTLPDASGSSRETDVLDLDALATLLGDAGAAAGDAPLSAELISGGRSNLTYRVTDGSRRWILRRPPFGEIMEGTHDVIREYRVMAGLSASKVPVPRVVLLDDGTVSAGAPCYLMDEVAGHVLRTPELVEAFPVPARRTLGEGLVDTLADLHDVDPEAVGLADLGRPKGYLERQLARWMRQYSTTKVRELDQVDEIARVLSARLPQHSEVSIVHGDYRIDNVIAAADGRVAAVLDWEMATLGDPLADLATLVMFTDEPGRRFNPITGGLTAVDGFLSKDAVVERYARRRRDIAHDLDWYLVFAQFKLAIILEQIHARHLMGNTVGDGEHGRVGPMVEELLAEAADGLALPGLRRRGAS